MTGLEGQRADSHGLLTAQQQCAYPLPGHTDTLDTPTYFHSARRIRPRQKNGNPRSCTRYQLLHTQSTACSLLTPSTHLK